MRRRVLRVAIVAVLIAVTVLGLPLAVVGRALVYDEEHGELERAALRAALTVSPDAAGGDPVELPRAAADLRVAVYGADGARISGAGPMRLPAAERGALRGNAVSTDAGRELAAVVPVSVDERVVAVARAASSRDVVRRQVALLWAGLVGVALVAGLGASAVAARQARRLTRPLDALVVAADEIGTGQLGRRVEPSGIDELDRAGAALNRTAARLDETLARQRSFNASASHQLRTPLTSLRLALDGALATPGADLRDAARRASRSAEALSQTVDDVLALAHGEVQQSTPVALLPVLEDLRDRWNGQFAATGRRLVLTRDPDAASVALGNDAALRQVLDVLMANAFEHGQGTVGVQLRDLGRAVAVDVTDQGSTTRRRLLPGATGGADTPSSGLGLSLAARLADDMGGRLLHAFDEPTTRFTLLLASV